jgi:phenylalanyl-tRNA synthetase beta subunit
MAREIAALFRLNLKEVDAYEKAESVVFSLEKVSKLLGREISESEIKSVFDAYHYQYEISDDEVRFFVPPWRKDINNVHDITDEIGRYVGYDTVPALLPELNKSLSSNDEYSAIIAKKAEMTAKGYHEVMTYSLVKKGDFQVAKGPKGKDFLRTNLLDGLRTAYALNKQNEALLPNNSANIFEVGRVFTKEGEELHVAWIDEKGEHEETLSIEGSSSYQEEVAEALRGRRSLGEGLRFKPWSDYPFTTRDIAVWIPESDNVADLVTIIKSNGTELLQGEPRLFDQFSKEGRTSYAYRMIFQAFDRTLTDDEVNAVMDKIHTEVKTKGWEVR